MVLYPVSKKPLNKDSEIMENENDSNFDKQVHRRKFGLKASLYLNMFALVLGISFFSPTLTGKAISTLDNVSSSIIGMVLIALSIIGFFLYAKLKDNHL